mmetsp:Transcript_126701/g.405676  ORF Transcript_126701/g.405676 Transcript_126701/m.405676 type:complete len:335 (-) Transcript_126701:301-1305(-)
MGSRSGSSHERSTSARATGAAEHTTNPSPSLCKLLHIDPRVDTQTIEHVHEVLCRQVAARGGTSEGATAEAACGSIHSCDALLEPDEHVGKSLAIRVVQVQGQSRSRDASSPDRLQDSPRLGRCRLTDGVTNQQLVASLGIQTLSDSHEVGLRDVTLVRADHRHNNGAAGPDASCIGGRDHSASTVQGILQAAICVPSAHGLSRCCEDCRLPNASRRRQLETAEVRHQCSESSRLAATVIGLGTERSFENCPRICHLRHGLWGDEGSRLDRGNTGSSKLGNECQFRLRVHHHLLVLQAIPWRHVHNAHRGGQPVEEAPAFGASGSSSRCIRRGG